MLMLVTVNPIKINPSSKTAARATRQSIPNPKTTEKAKQTFSPMTGARAKEYLA